MKIDSILCMGCGECVDYCPANAIHETGDKTEPVSIIQKACVQCGVCRRVAICPVDAIIGTDDTAPYPLKIQALFSDPNTTHKKTLVPGRGTEESKTNDVTDRYQQGEIGCCIELGRPGICCTFRDIAIVSRHLIQKGFRLEENNPVTDLMDLQTGSFSEDLRARRILSAIIEVKFLSARLEELIGLIKQVSKEIETVFSLGFICRFDDDGGLSICDRLTRMGLPPASNAKINLGIGHSCSGRMKA